MAIAAAPPWEFWTFVLRRFAWLVEIFGAIEVTGEVPDELRRGPLLLAVNHIGDFDPFVIAVALHRIGVTPRFMATGGIVAAPVIGPVLERTGVIRVQRGTELARHAVRVTEVALVSGGHVIAYPEGRIGLTRDGWPERGRTGMARLALGLGIPVIPISQWGAHEVLQYRNDWGKLRTLVRAIVRRPALRVHVGPPVVLDDLRPGRGGRREPGAVPDRRRDHPRPGAAAGGRHRAPALRRPHPSGHRRRRLPRGRRPGRRAVTVPGNGRPRNGHIG